MREPSKKNTSKYAEDKYLHLSPEEQAWALSIRNNTVGFKEIQQKIKKEQEEKIQATKKQINTLKIEKISALFQEKDGVAIKDIAKTLDMSRNELFDFLIENNKILGDIRISDRKMFITDREDISEFMKILDEQFKKWGFGKKSDKIKK